MRNAHVRTHKHISSDYSVLFNLDALKRHAAKPIALILAIACIWLTTDLLQKYALSSASLITVVEFTLAERDASGRAEFALVEQHLAAIYKDDTQNIEVTAEFDKKLSMAINGITSATGIFPAASKMLLEKSFPGVNGRKLAVLTECFYYYKQAEARILEETLDVASTGDNVPGIPDLVALQAAYFGETLSRSLFSDYHHLYQQLNAATPADNMTATPTNAPDESSSALSRLRTQEPIERQHPETMGSTLGEGEQARVRDPLTRDELPVIPAIHEQACAPLAAAFARN